MMLIITLKAFSLLAVLFLAGCASVNLPTEKELNQILEQQKVIVLLKINATRDGKPFEPFKSEFTEVNVHFGLGNFETGGKPKPVLTQRFLSQESRKEGWTYFIIKPEIYYLIFYPLHYGGPFPSDDFPRWKFTIPKSAKYIYIGTARFNFKNHTEIHYDSLVIENDDIEAEMLISKYLSADEKELSVSLMKKYKGGAIELRRPIDKE